MSNDTTNEVNFDAEPTAAGFVMPSSPADRKHIMDVMFEISGSKTRTEAERDFQKDAIDDLSKKFNIPKRLLNRFAKAYHRSAFQEELSVDSDFELLVDTLTNTNS